MFVAVLLLNGVLLQATERWLDEKRDRAQHDLRAGMPAMHAATAQLVIETARDEPDYAAVAGAAATMSVAL